MADLAVIADLKLYLGVDHDDDDALLADLLADVSAAIRKHTGRTFEKDAGDGRVEYIDGGVGQLIVDNPPISSITKIEDTFNDDEEVDADNYDFDPGSGLIYISQDATASLSDLGELQRWGAGRRRWKVTYVGGGYEAVPADVALACKVWIADIYAHRDDLPSERLGDHQTGRTGGDMPERVKGLLSKYAELPF